jgi:hypothetical protein
VSSLINAAQVFDSLYDALYVGRVFWTRNVIDAERAGLSFDVVLSVPASRVSRTSITLRDPRQA